MATIFVDYWKVRSPEKWENKHFPKFTKLNILSSIFLFKDAGAN